MLNLLSNAVKFTPFGGNVLIKAKTVKSIDDLTFNDDLLIQAIVNNPNMTFLEIQV